MLMSIHKEEVEVLKRRSLEFLEEAKEALRRGFYDVACFLAEQSLQLYLKSLLLEIVGDYPRTHSVRRLLGEVANVLSSEELRRFVKVNRARLLALEDTYLMARYYVRRYEREDAEDMIKVVKEVIDVINRLRR